MTSTLVSALFYLLVFALALWRPNAGRIFIGIFFLVMAFGVNLTVAILDPSLFVQLGQNSFLPIQQVAFREVVAANPLFWGGVIMAYETTLALLILNRGRWVQIGLIMAILFLLGITPLGVDTLTNPILALVCQYLLTREFPVSFMGLVRLRLVHR